MTDFSGALPLTHLLPDVRAAAARYVVSKGHGDLLDMLGLDEPAMPEQIEPAERRSVAAHPCP